MLYMLVFVYRRSDDCYEILYCCVHKHAQVCCEIPRCDEYFTQRQHLFCGIRVKMRFPFSVQTHLCHRHRFTMHTYNTRHTAHTHVVTNNTNICLTDNSYKCRRGIFRICEIKSRECVHFLPQTCNARIHDNDDNHAKSKLSSASVHHRTV